MNARDYLVRARAGICVYGLLGSYELLTLDLQPSACCDALGAVHHGPVSVLLIRVVPSKLVASRLPFPLRGNFI